MTETNEHSFDEDLLSGYMDGMLTQADRQRVELHLDSCRDCLAWLGEMGEVRQATLGTVFQAPEDRQWDERARTPLSALSRRTGWLIFLAWAIATAAFGAFHLALATEGWWERIVAFGGLAGLAALFASVLLDRLRDLETDRYRSVEK